MVTVPSLAIAAGTILKLVAGIFTKVQLALMTLLTVLPIASVTLAKTDTDLLGEATGRVTVPVRRPEVLIAALEIVVLEALEVSMLNR
jgi:hypothetical protein